MPAPQIMDFCVGYSAVDKVVDMPVVFNDRLSMSLPAQFIDGCGRPCAHAETVFCVQFLDKVVTCPLL